MSNPASFDATLPAETLADSSGGTRTEAIATGSLLGRYIVTQILGAGAMGVVYAAYDPRLDRKVALKLLKPNEEQLAARQRLQREAQALAKLDHRNVVGVYDVGTHGEQLFVAMEFVAGRDLALWIREHEGPRAWREVLEVFLAAGRGLAAAHEAELIHRDFKPANVMLGDDGRVRVMDFGLARGGRGDRQLETESSVPERPEYTRAQLDVDDPSLPTEASESELLSRTVTRAGALVGTPGYMAPELLGGHPASALSDQFAFCVALHEALYGRRPFEGGTLGQLLTAIEDRAILPPPKGTSVPAWLRKVVVRGLESDASARWPSMHALLEALARDPARRTRRVLVAMGLVGALAGLGWSATRASAAPASTCVGFERHLEGVWDLDARARVRAGFERSGSAYARGAAELLAAGLNAYTEDWVRARTEACEASERGEQSEALLDLRMSCLDERLLHVRELVGALAEADAAMVDKAEEGLEGLPSLERCADAKALRAELPPPEDPQVAAQVTELDARVVQLRTRAHLGEYESALELGEQTWAAARELGYGPLEARVALERGKLSMISGAYERAEPQLREAYALAVEHAMKREAAETTLELLSLYSTHLERYEEARRWVEHADPWTRAGGDPSQRAMFLYGRGSLALHEGALDQAQADFEAMLERSAELPAERELAQTSLGHLANERGDYAEARQIHTRALGQRMAESGPLHPRTALALVNLGRAQASLVELEQAEQSYAHARAIWLHHFGPEHPDVTLVEANLANLALRRSDHARALAMYERALAQWERSLGPKHPKVGLLLSNMAECLRAMDEHGRALELYERAREIVETGLGPEHPMVPLLEFNRGLVAMDLGDHALALDIFERSLLAFEAAKGPEHLQLATVIRGLVSARLALGQIEGSRALLERALAIERTQLGPDAPASAYTLTQLGELELEAGQPARALEALERALELRGAGPNGDPLSRAENLYLLARASWEAPPDRGQDHERARELLGLARVNYAKDPKRAAAQVAKLEQWAARSGIE